MENDGIITATLDVYVTERGAYKKTLICSDPVDYTEVVEPNEWRKVGMKPMPRITFANRPDAEKLIKKRYEGYSFKGEDGTKYIIVYLEHRSTDDDCFVFGADLMVEE